MDINMPLLDGYDTTIQLKLQFKSRITIIACTAYDDCHTKLKCKEVGMDGFLSKPL